MTGTLYGIGVGPGDPGLVTCKALAILRQIPVVAFVSPDGKGSMARSIVEGLLPDGQTELVLDIPMGLDPVPADRAYDRAATDIAELLDDGRDVAVLCQGDPFFYGTFMYLFERLAADYPTEVIPGVTSLSAAAAAAATPLVARDETLTVIPATLSEDDLERRLGRDGGAVLVKVGRHLEKVRRVLGRLGLARDAHYVERVGMTDERVTALDDAGDGPAPYFSLVLTRGTRAAGASIPESPPAGAAIVVLTPGALPLARRLAGVLPGARVHGLAGRADDTEVTFSGTVDHLRKLFTEGVPIVGLCASGILVRALAPLLADKRAEPPVIAVAEDGSAAVPLLGGHQGANALARAVAAVTGGVAAVTTAGDVRHGLALDEPPTGWRIANGERVKDVAAALLADEPVALRVEAGDASWLTMSGAPFAEFGDKAVRVTDRAVTESSEDLVFHPPVLAVGVGGERGVDPSELIALVEQTLADAGFSLGAVACICSLDLKMDEPAVAATARRLGVPVRYFTAAELEAETPRLANPSEYVFETVGCHGVSEGAALAAAGSKGSLVVEKTASARATCAVARAPGGIDGDAVGRARGRLAVVGIGPGPSDWRTPEASTVLAEASDVVGYSLYLDLIAGEIAGKNRHEGALGQEEARTRRALDLAAEGRAVALVSSGDAGIYALASLVFELMDREDRPDWNRIDLSVVPGVSALQAAAARIGAPLGHDFCAISLSDLLTPWSDIERRLEAAADGDFAVALYNPVSGRRRRQLAIARDVLLGRRSPETPVVLARNLGRDGETVEVIRLADLTPDDADMLTLVLVGNSRTKAVERGEGRWVYTPRGYADKGVGEPVDAAVGKEAAVHFVGAGPGAPDLITVRGLELIRRCPVVLYAGSLVPADVIKEAPASARVVDTAPLTLDDIVAEMEDAHGAGLDVARVHSGDPSVYGAIAEQMRRLDDLSIPYDVTPGVPAYAAAAAAMRRELTLPEISQTVVVTRTGVRTAMPEGEDLTSLGRSGATLAIHLSINNLARVVKELTPLYGADCPVVVAHRVSWPDERFIDGTLADIRAQVKAAGITRTALILVGRVFGEGAHAESRLYAADHSHVLRPKKRA